MHTNKKLLRHTRGNISIAKGTPIQNTNDIEKQVVGIFQFIAEFYDLM